MKRKLIHPESGCEPLFHLLKDKGFQWEGLNSSEETARAEIDTLEESGLLPGPLMAMVANRLKPYSGYLCFKLDWILGKSTRPLKGGQTQDGATSAISVEPGCVKIGNSGPGRTSDHLPIYADIDLA